MTSFERPGRELPPALWSAVRAAYAAPGRVYHDFAHVEEVLARFAEVAHDVGWRQPREVYLALVLHDLVYVAGMPDNEAQSAERARELVAELLPAAGLDVARVDRLIRLTARHGALDGGELDGDAALFVDCDMAIVGAEPARFDAYDAAVAAEYAGLPLEWYRAGRRRFLARLLGAPRIFWSDYFHQRLDGAARANLARALARLGD